MNYYGDASGHLRGLLNGECEAYVAAVVAGDRIACGRCPKQAIRRVDDLPEAKWCDLMPKQKRRVFECFADNEHIEFGYALFTLDQLQSLKLSHLLYQGVELPPAWDLALEGYAYGELLFELDAGDDRHQPTFTFDRVASKDQSEQVADHVHAFVDNVNPFIEGSRKSKGIQAADCFAGAVAEDYQSATDWLGYLDDDRITESSATSLIQLEHRLSEYSSEP